MITNRNSLLALACTCVAALSSFAAPPETGDTPQQEGSFLLITRDFLVRSIRLAAISDQSLVMMEKDRGWVTLDLKQCVALLNPAASDDAPHAARGMLVLADGQRLPGEAVTGAAPQPDTLAWNHPWLGRVDVPFKLIESVLLTPDAVAPASGNADVVLTVNGDRQEGFVTAIGDPVTIEVTPPAGDNGVAPPSQKVNIPLSRVTAITMVAPRQQGAGRRVWFAEGTVLDVQSIAVGDDGYVKMNGGTLTGDRDQAAATQQPRVVLSDVAAMLFDRETLLPLASLPPSRVEGPTSRYVLPRPAMLDPDAALGLSTIEYSGPLVTRYALPAGCQRFIAEAELPRGDREWGDCELIVRSDDEQVFRTHLSAATPTASINAPIKGRELTIEITAGAHGPIQDLVRLHRPLLLKGK